MPKFTYRKYQNRLSIANKVARAAWNVYEVLFFRTMPTQYLNGVRILGLRLFGAKLGRKGVTVHRTVKIWAPWNLVMDDYTLIDKNCRVYNPGRVTIHSETVVSENVFLCTASHDVHSLRHELVTAPIELMGQNWIAADVIILPGVTVGEGSVVGCGAVVSRDVPAWKIVAGNPARIVKDRVVQDSK